MREAVALRLEQASYFEHRALAGGRDRVICAYRLIEIRGARFHVLSRLQDAGLDFTSRTNFIAHHLVFLPDEITAVPLAPDIFLDWGGWRTSWTGESRLLENEIWGNLYSVGKQPHSPAQTWERMTGDAANALGPLDHTAGTPIETDSFDESTVLRLASESLALLEVREPESDFRSGAWRFTFTTSLQEQDEALDFRWRFIHSDSAAYARLTANGQTAMPLAQLLPKSPTNEAVAFARKGPQPPRICREPEDLQIQERQQATLRVEVEGVPVPKQFQWIEYARDGEEKPIVGQTGPELRLREAALGVNRYRVKVSNARGETVMSRVAQVLVEKALGRMSPSLARTSGSVGPAASTKVRPVQLTAWAADAEETARFLESVRLKKRRKKMLSGAFLVLCVLAVAGLLFSQPGKSILSALLKPHATTNAQPATTIAHSETETNQASQKSKVDPAQLQSDAVNTNGVQPAKSPGELHDIGHEKPAAAGTKGISTNTAGAQQNKP